MKPGTHSFLIAMLATTLVVATSGTAQAFSLDISTSWKMGDYVSVTNSSGVAEAGSLAAELPSYARSGVAWQAGKFERSGVNFHLGFGVGPNDRIAPYLGFGMNRISYKNDYLLDVDGDDDDDTVIDQGAATQIGIELGMRGFLTDRGHSLASPFIRFSFTKYIGMIDEYVDGSDGVDYYEDVLCAASDDDDCASDYEKFDEAILSPQGFRVAFGAEYYFNDNFSVGADLFGVEIFWASASNPQDAERLANFVSMAFYSTLNLTYRFIPKKRAKKEPESYESDYDFDYED